VYFNYKKSKVFFYGINDNPCYDDVKKYAFFWLSWSESLFTLASYDGVVTALGQAKLRHAEPYDVLEEYITEFFPRKCHQLKRCLVSGLLANSTNNNNDSAVLCLDNDIAFTPGSKFNFGESENYTPQTGFIYDSSKYRPIISVTPSKFCNKSLGTPGRVPVDSINASCSEDNVIKKLENSFVTQPDLSNSQILNETQLNAQRDISLPDNKTEAETTLNSQIQEEGTPCKRYNYDPPETPTIKEESFDEKVNPVEYLRSTCPTITTEEILQICQAIKPEEQLENINADEQFRDIDPSMFVRGEEDDTLRRYSYVKFTESSLCHQLKILPRYGHLYGTSVVPRSKKDPTPVRRSLRLEAKTPQSVSKTKKANWKNVNML